MLHAMRENQRGEESVGSAMFRFYAELNDFLSPSAGGRERIFRFCTNQSVKAAIEGFGVPHTEVDLILVNGTSVDFHYQVADHDRISVYPVFKSLDITGKVRVRESPPRDIRFVLDANLGKLARWLRLLGFDSLYRNDFEDAELAGISEREKRVLLTRDRRVLHHKRVTHGYWVRSDQPDLQIIEVLRRFQIEAMIRTFSRCLECNGRIHAVPKSTVLHRLEPKTKTHYQDFSRCGECGKVYWRGTHYDRLLDKLKRVVAAEAMPEPSVAPARRVASGSSAGDNPLGGG